jgi:hypothetical protein
MGSFSFFREEADDIESVSIREGTQLVFEAWILEAWLRRPKDFALIPSGQVGCL